MSRPANPRLTRAEKAALLSVAERGFISWSLGVHIKDTVMLTRLARKGLLRRNPDGSVTRWLTRAGRLVIAGMKSRPDAGRYFDRRSWSNPKVGRSHIARKLGLDPWGFACRVNEFDPEMRP